MGGQHHRIRGSVSPEFPGESYFKQKTDLGWKYYGEFRHLNYYLNHDIPVILVIIDIFSEKAFWTLCDAAQTDRNKKGWSIIVPFDNELTSNSKQELSKYISPTIDYVSQLENYWKINDALKSYGKIYFIAGKEDILRMNYSPIIDGFQRIAENKELLNKHKESIEIGIQDYDSDPRELNEVNEVRNWVKNIIDNVEGLSFFLVKDEFAQFMKLILFCHIDFKIVEGSEHIVDGMTRWKVKYDSKDMVPIMNRLFYDLNSFCKKNDIPLNINKEISENIINCFSDGDYSKNKNNKA